jgi:hypothetical protein
MSSDDKKPKPKSECVGWDCGAGAIRIANMDTRYRPEPQLITSQMDDRHFLAMTCMRVPQAFHRSTLFNTPAHIIMDAFRCQPTKSDYLFCVKRENDEYIIPSHRRLMKNNPTPEDLEANGIPPESQTFKHEKIMESIIQEISKAFNVRNVSQKEAYICVPDAASLDHIRKLRRAFIKVFTKRQKAKETPKLEDTKSSDPPVALDGEEPLKPSNIFFIQRTAAAIQMYFHRRSGVKVYNHNREQFHRENRDVPYEKDQIILPRTVVVIAFGAGHFSSAIYKQETFERYGIRHIFNQSDDALGGEDLCYRLCEYAATHPKLDEDGKKALKNPRLKKFLRNTMDQAKIDLSGFTPAIVDVEVNDDKVETLEITRDDFEKIIAKTEFDKIENYIKNLKDHTKGLDVTDVLLVRGSTRTKRILDLVGDYFPGVPIVKCLNTDECIVMGTALKGALKNGIHRTAYAEVEDVAMHDQWVEIDGIQLFLTKKYESVQNSKEHWIEPLGKHKLTYNGKEIDTKSNKRFSWKRDVACDPCIMTENQIHEEMTKGFNPANNVTVTA